MITHNKPMRHVTWLAHHGIKGQQWGIKNGPPYPLSDKKHDRVVKKADISEKKDTSKKETAGSKFKDLWKNDPEFRRGMILTGAILAGTAALYLYGNKEQIEFLAKAGKNFIQNGGDKLLKSKLPEQLAKPGKSFDEIDDKLVQSVNGMQYFTKGDGAHNNCLCCTAAYIADTICGESYKAGLSKDGFTRASYKEIFDNVEPLYERKASMFRYDPNDIKPVSELKNILKKGTTGAINVANAWGAHAIAYECDGNGDISIVDCQIGKKFKFDDWVKTGYSQCWIESAYNMSNATMKDEQLILRSWLERKYFGK